MNMPMPFLPAIIGCIVGVVWQEHAGIQHPGILFLLFIAVLPLALHAYLLRSKNHIITTTVMLCMVGTATLCQLPTYALERCIQATNNKKVALSGTIQDVHKDGRTKTVTLSNIDLETNNKHITPVWCTQALVFVPASCPTPHGGTMTLLNTHISAPPETLKNYLLKQHLLGFFFPQKDSLVVHSPKNDSTWLETQKARLICAINNVFSPATQTMVSSIFLGQSQALTSETRSLFEQWGISHYLARSGLHLVLLATLMIFILGLCGLPLLATRGSALGLSILYHLLTFPSTSFLRAFMMNIMIGISLFLGTTPTMLHLFSIVTLITILFNPFTVLNLDFQLSFGISGALIFMFNSVQQLGTQKITGRKS